MSASLELSIDIDAPVADTWAAVVNWDRQGEWMLWTRARGTAQGGQGVGGGIAALTGFGKFGVLDTMEITRWEPPYRCEVLHTGRVVRGTGAFEVRDRGAGTSTFVWREDLDLPLGAVGRLGWWLLRPLFRAGVQASLRKLARSVETG
jgi:hypothetical protein